MNPAIFDRPSGAGALLGVGDIATPTAGYSLRYLSINYFGQPVIRVRKDVVGNPEQDFTPSQLTDGTLATFADGNDCFVSKWYDQFGSNDATNSTAAEQPKIWDASTGLVTENGRPAIEFDGSDDGLATSAFAFSASSVSAFVAYKNGSTSGQKNIFRQRPNGAKGATIGYVWEMGADTLTTQYGKNTLFDDGSGAISGDLNGQGTQDLNQHLETLIYKSAEILAYQDGGLNETLNDTFGTTPIGAISMTQSLWIGRNFDSNDREYDGLMQEIIIYNTDQSANRTKIEDNINDYYDIY